MTIVLWLGELMREMPACDVLIHTREPITLEQVQQYSPTVIIANRYRHLIPGSICNALDGKMFNVHCSYLPWNRGAHPNYWGWKEPAPHGVTLHCMSARLDYGDIVAQVLLRMEPENHTLQTSYEELEFHANALLLGWFDKLCEGDFPRAKQLPNTGSYHRASALPNLPLGWDTPVEEL